MISDVSELSEYGDKLKQLAAHHMDEFMKWASRQIAARFIDDVVKLTPVQEPKTIQYRMAGGKIGTQEVTPGALRRGWTGGAAIKPEEYSLLIPVARYGTVYQLDVTNNVSYASFVEYGHAQKVGRFVPYIGEKLPNGVMSGARLVQSDIKGYNMMTNAAARIQEMAPGLADKLIREYLDKHLE